MKFIEHTLFGECGATVATLVRNKPVLLAFNVTQMKIGAKDKPGTYMSQKYAMLSACHAHSILLESMILNFWTHNFHEIVISLFVVQWL